MRISHTSLAKAHNLMAGMIFVELWIGLITLYLSQKIKKK